MKLSIHLNGDATKKYFTSLEFITGTVTVGVEHRVSLARLELRLEGD